MQAPAGFGASIERLLRVGLSDILTSRLLSDAASSKEGESSVKESQLNHSNACQINICISTIVRSLGMGREELKTNLN